MTEIKAAEGTISGYAILGDSIVSDRELENLYAYLKETECDRKRVLIEVTRKAKRMEDGQARLGAYYRRMQERLETRNRDLDRIADMLEGM